MTMKSLTFVAVALGAVTVLSSASQAGWSSRIDSTPDVIPTNRIQRVGPIENYKLPTRADKVQGMPPYSATFANSPYADTAARPAPVAVPPTAAGDPAYFDHALGNNHY